ncbi:hypothetical protein BUALT_Bualt05G0017900 [Buddleja alternifolia]|uniref:Uncharacterized protein n=1 Tax=Buddleja alternifolia TaxID=168488 RepID=A0AAV6XMS7_9LAMI|nr:hypothetical protein BUALT_Bualt05G0017900 [Buddleja alternifolia]
MLDKILVVFLFKLSRSDEEIMRDPRLRLQSLSGVCLYGFQLQESSVVLWFHDWSCSTLVGLAVAESIGLEQICKKSYMILPCAFPIAQQLVIVIFTANNPMGFMAVDYSSAPHVEPKTSETMVNEENEIRKRMKTIESDLQPSHEEHNPEDKSMCQEKVTGHETLDNGYLKYGYNVPIIAGGAALELPVAMRYSIVVTVITRQKTVFASIRSSDTISLGTWLTRLYAHYVTQNRRFDKFAQIVAYAWEDTIVEFASCLMMSFIFILQTSKEQYHCDGCGICRIGGAKNFFHCDKCGCCYSAFLKNSHPCIERAMHQDCPVCFEYLFESRNDVIALPCGHTIHKTCLDEMKEHYQYACPICSKSVCDMSKVWEKFDLEIAATPMPPYCDNKKVWILCNDCGSNSEVKYHVVAQKCPNCKSYNTRQTRDSSQHEDIGSGPSLPNQESRTEPTQHNMVDEIKEPLQPNREKGRSIVSRAGALLGVDEEFSQASSSLLSTLLGLQPEQQSQRNTITTRQRHSAISDSSQHEDIGSSSPLPNQESCMEPTLPNIINETVEPLLRNCDKGRSIVSRAVSLLGVEEELSQVSSSMQTTLLNLQPEQQNQHNLITTRQIHSAISASENIRTFCSITAGILVMLSYTGFPMLSSHVFTSVVFFRPVYLLLLTNISIVIGRLVLGAQGAVQRTSSVPTFGGNGLVDQMGKALELGLLLKKISGAFFMDFSIYAVVLICGFSLVRTLGW